MQAGKDSLDRLVREFTEHHMNALFYFCLKKTGSTAEAEDLTQDIALQILTALHKGTIPTSFSAWVWQIARNRYAVWAKHKRHQNETLIGASLDEMEIEDESEPFLDAVIRQEQMRLLRRELAFIKRDYRRIVVAYYIENKSIREIASSLSLPPNTVKSKLFRARERLKEGMYMAREFGKRSYSPQDISFTASGSQPSGLPWSAVKRRIPKNILLQASNNPSTLEELSIELGIALPYMEEEVEILHHATLLEKQGDTYITNFFILDKDCRIDVYQTLRKNARERSRLMKDFIDDCLSAIRGLGIAAPHIDDNTIRWWLVPHLIDDLIDHTEAGENIYTPPMRANGESWGFVGYEEVKLPENTVMGHNGYGNGRNHVWAYKYNDYSLWNQCGEPEYEEALLLCDCIRNKRNTSSFTDIEKGFWKRINGKYAHADKNGEIVSDLLVLTSESLRKIHQLFSEFKQYEKLTKNVTEAYKNVEAIFKKYSHKVLHDNLGYNVQMEMYAMRMMAIHDLVEDGFLTLPEDPKASSLGMCIVLN